MSFKQIVLVFTSSVLLLSDLMAQSEYTKVAIETFKNLDRSGIKSGIFYDRVFPAASLNTFTSSDTSNSGHFYQAFAELYWASYSTDRRINPDEIKVLSEQKLREGTIALGVINTPFHVISNYDAIELDGTGHYRVKAN